MSLVFGARGQDTPLKITTRAYLPSPARDIRTNLQRGWNPFLCIRANYGQRPDQPRHRTSSWANIQISNLVLFNVI